MQKHEFTGVILEVLKEHFGDQATAVFEKSALMGYLNIKTKSAASGSKARGAFANHYALYVLIEDYLAKGFHLQPTNKPYAKYEGARFSDLFKRQRELPFGAKLQNHALNARLNDEFKKYYPTAGITPIVRDVASQRYWIHEDLLLVDVQNADGTSSVLNVAPAIIKIIDAYVQTKRAAFEEFLATCLQLSDLAKDDVPQATEFIVRQLQPNVDARVFEIVSYAILKAKYGSESVWIGNTKKSVAEFILKLYKTGRTNANDGGIDFVMKPLGRFFQVTETVDVGKYFLDIDKVQRFPITFVVKTANTKAEIRTAIQEQAIAKYKIQSVVDGYMEAVEEIITVADLSSFFDELVLSERVQEVMLEIIQQGKLEFNYMDVQEILEEVAEE